MVSQVALRSIKQDNKKPIAGLKGICNIADDVLIHEKDSDENLYHFLVRMREVKLKLNRAKYIFKTQKVMFIGFQLNPDGVSPSPSMVEAITKMPKPSDQHAVQR